MQNVESVVGQEIPEEFFASSGNIGQYKKESMIKINLKQIRTKNDSNVFYQLDGIKNSGYDGKKNSNKVLLINPSTANSSQFSKMLSLVSAKD